MSETISMDTMRFALVEEQPGEVPTKVRNLKDIPEEMAARHKALELEKQRLAEERGAWKDCLDPAARAAAKANKAERLLLKAEMHEYLSTLKAGEPQRREAELEKQKNAAAREAALKGE